MPSKGYKILLCALGVLWAANCWPTSGSLYAATDSTDSLQQFSTAGQNLYQKITPALVRVKLRENFDDLLTSNLRKDFEEWRDRRDRRQPPGPPNGSSMTPEGGPKGPIFIRPYSDRHEERESNSNNATNRPAHPNKGNPENADLLRGDSGNANQFRKFLEWQSQNLNNPEAARRARFILQRLEAFRNGQGQEVLGITYNAEGNTLVLTSLVTEVRHPKIRNLRNTLREVRGKEPLPQESEELPTVTVVTSSGLETKATILGTDLLRGISIIKIDHPQGFLPLASNRPNPGELLSLISAHNGASSWVNMPANLLPAPTRQNNSLNHDIATERFAVNAENHGPAFIINTSGQIAALGFGDYAIPVEVLKTEIAQLPREGFVRRVQVGVKWAPVTAEERLKMPDLGQKPAVRVDDVLPNSPAQLAGLKPGDYILSVDHHPMNRELLPTILANIVAHPGSIDMEVLRGKETLTLKLTFSQPANP